VCPTNANWKFSNGLKFLIVVHTGRHLNWWGKIIGMSDAGIETALNTKIATKYKNNEAPEQMP